MEKEVKEQAEIRPIIRKIWYRYGTQMRSVGMRERERKRERERARARARQKTNETVVCVVFERERGARFNNLRAQSVLTYQNFRRSSSTGKIWVLSVRSLSVVSLRQEVNSAIGG